MGKYNKRKSFAGKLREGYGSGHGKDYKPFITVRDVPARTTTPRILGWKTQRVHHLLSPLETAYFYVLDWHLAISDIREQFPLLPLEETLEIANRLKIAHPPRNETEKVPLTTDFMIDVYENGNTLQLARTVKLSDELASVRILEKFEIERTFYKEIGIDWGIVTEKDFSKTLATNVSRIHKFKDLKDYPGMTPEIVSRIEPIIYDLAMERKIRLAHAALSVDDRLGIESGSTLCAVKHLIANRIWIIDMNMPFETHDYLDILARNIDNSNEYEVRRG